ncbi:hypothetical protein GN244_ATG10839 [Phytophthora infestans]|uniref:Uncharacterized protein n=1 Tax=Phytophthora infestans TaxID=4787 RepID=A0A833T0X2_PHYIN|nr:hypothetical protein GN244_ATG10839 [Phytophthora infestans]
MHAVLATSFSEAITEKLVFDDRATVFFKMGLKECRRQAFIFQLEEIEWDLKATKINVENADWVGKIKQSLQDLQCETSVTKRNVELLRDQFNSLRNVRIQREKCEMKQRERQRYISLKSVALILCGGGAINHVFKDALDMGNVEGQLSKSYTEYTDFLQGRLTDQTNSLIFNDGLNAILTDAVINPAEFSTVL